MTTLSFVDERPDPNDWLPTPPAQGKLTTASASLPASNSPAQIIGPRELEELIAAVEARGLVFEPWQIASFITAIRTKPFVILAGVSGTGKTKLPTVVGELTGAEVLVAPVKPDWTDSADLLGYQKIDGGFVPGTLLQFAKGAMDDPDRQYIFVLDEMNIARVEYYLAEVLSRIESFKELDDGTRASAPLLSGVNAESEWMEVVLPDNLAIVGSVNMDETTFGFSKKVLDRAFSLEFSSIDLTRIAQRQPVQHALSWPAQAWRRGAISLADDPRAGTPGVVELIDLLSRINKNLEVCQLQFGYRLRDEVVLFCLNARDYVSSFRTRTGVPISALDVALTTKVLPRVQGGGPQLSQLLESLSSFASNDGQDAVGDSDLPMFFARCEMMRSRLELTGFTSFWL